MFKEPTVLVLGAGASVPYGYPTGAELVERVKSLSSHYPRSDILDALKAMPPLSIDDFLSNNPSLASVGKMLVAKALLEKQRVDHTPSARDDWYTILHGALTPAGVANIKEVEEAAKHLTIITFNYDTSLEYQLFTRLSYKTSRFAPVADKIMKNITIIHVYGCLHEIPDWTVYKNHSEQNRQFSFGENFFNTTHLNEDAAWHEFSEKCSANLKTIHDDRSEKQSAVDKLKAASKIYILGYGFNDTNNERIGLLEAIRDTEKCVSYVNYNGAQKTVDLLMRTLRFGAQTYTSTDSIYNALFNDFPFP